MSAHTLAGLRRTCVTGEWVTPSFDDADAERAPEVPLEDANAAEPALSG